MNELVLPLKDWTLLRTHGGAYLFSSLRRCVVEMSIDSSFHTKETMIRRIIFTYVLTFFRPTTEFERLLTQTACSLSKRIYKMNEKRKSDHCYYISWQMKIYLGWLFRFKLLTVFPPYLTVKKC